MSDKVRVVPCSGIGKVYGLMARETALRVIGELCPDQSKAVCLAYIMTGDKEVQEDISGKDCITIDGCTAMCAAKNVAIAGGVLKEAVRVLDALKTHRGARPGNGTLLSDQGWQIVDELAVKVAQGIKEGYQGE